MKLLTQFELASKSDTELLALLREAFNSAAASTPGQQKHRNALQQMENIRKVLIYREISH